MHLEGNNNASVAVAVMGQDGTSTQTSKPELKRKKEENVNPMRCRAPSD